MEDSAWSDQTTFTTGATRNLYTYYKERVEVLENRLAGLEADEVVDDATDVTLLTAFANLVAAGGGSRESIISWCAGPRGGTSPPFSIASKNSISSLNSCVTLPIDD